MRGARRKNFQPFGCACTVIIFPLLFNAGLENLIRRRETPLHDEGICIGAECNLVNTGYAEDMMLYEKLGGICVLSTDLNGRGMN